MYGTERTAGFSSRKPREERYYGCEALGSNRSVTDERGRVAGTQPFDPWGVPDPGGHAGGGQGTTLLVELLGDTCERRDGWTPLPAADRDTRRGPDGAWSAIIRQAFARTGSRA